ncbi:MAG: hypothetical protein KatS3mg103_1360 [Phycisphaerales bacterium]|nr:MAG: hypothetical protein KatS3mg103_1360 [Phycisphaerales bacterium]
MAGDVASLLHAEAAVPGDLHVLPTGTIHALGAGTLVGRGADAQRHDLPRLRLGEGAGPDRPPACTWTRAQRCILESPPPAARRIEPGQTAGRLCALEAFSIDQIQPQGADHVPLAFDGRCQVLMVLQGAGEVLVEGDDAARLPVHAGHTVVVPAAVADRCVFVCDPAVPPGGASLLRVGVGPADGARG